MKKILFFIAMTIMSLNIFAQTTISNTVSEFSKLSIVGSVEVTLVKGDTPMFDAVLENTTADKFTWQMSDGTLVLELKEKLSLKKNAPDPKVTLTLYYSDLSAISVDGDGLACNKDVLEAGSLQLNLKSKGVIVLNVDAEDINIDASNSTATLSGTAEFLTVKATSIASVNTSNLVAEIANITSQTNAECFVHATRKLDAKATTNAKIFYKGDPELLNVSTATFGEIGTL